MRNLFKYQFTLFIALLFLWNLFFPIFEGVDEMGHFCSVDYISHKNRIPNLLIKDGCFIWHPPLYYALLSPIIKTFNLPQFESQSVPLNPNADALRKGQYAQYIHNYDELLLKWSPLIWEVHILRLFTSLFALLMFFITWKISSKLLPKSLLPNLSLVLFFNPMFLHIFSVISNVALISLISTVFIVLDLKFKNKNIRVTFLQGIILGLGFITKVSAVSLIPAFLIIIFFGYLKKKYSLSNLILKLVIFTIGFSISAGWYIVRNLQLYGEVIEANVVSRLYGPSHHFLLLQQVGPINYVNSIVLSLFKTFWSSYGVLTIRFPEIINVFLLTLTLLVAFTLFKKRRNLNSTFKIAIIYALSITVVLFIMNFKLAAMHAKDLFPAYIPFALLFGYGLSQSKEFVNKMSLKIFLVTSFTLGTYMFAQVEIVQFIKSAFQLDYRHAAILTLAIAFKSVLVFAVANIVLSIMGKTKLDSKAIVVLTSITTLIDIAILFTSVYLLYKNFV